MKTKDINWEDQKIEEIKKRKRNLKKVIDPFIKKQIVKDLKRERRSVKRSAKNFAKQHIKEELDKFTNND